MDFKIPSDLMSNEDFYPLRTPYKWAWIAMLSLAADSENRGTFELHPGDTEKLLHLSYEKFVKLGIHLKKLGWLEQVQTSGWYGTFRIVHWDRDYEFNEKNTREID